MLQKMYPVITDQLVWKYTSTVITVNKSGALGKNNNIYFIYMFNSSHPVQNSGPGVPYI